MINSLLNSRKSIKILISLLVLLVGINIVVLITFIKPENNSAYLLISLFILLTLLIIFSVFKIHYEINHLSKELRNTYIQMESSNLLNKLITPKIPFPTTGDWAATSHFIAEIYKYVLKNNPETIVELGSGASTLYTAQLISDHNLKSKIISLDHDKAYGDKTTEHLRNADLENIAQVHIAPLKTHDINGKSWQWYSTDSLEVSQTIDVLVVDGPITYLQNNARYPAIPLLMSRLTSGAIILVDDYNRPDEQAIVALWQKEFGLKLIEEVTSVKGFAVLQKP